MPIPIIVAARVAARVRDVAARVRASPVVARVEAVTVDPPRVRLVTVLGLAAALLAAGWYYGHRVAADRDRWWRAEIAAKSAGVRRALADAAPGIHLTDAEVIRTMGDTDAKLVAAEAKLDSFLAPSVSQRENRRVHAAGTEGAAPSGAAHADGPEGAAGVCPRIPRRCLR